MSLRYTMHYYEKLTLIIVTYKSDDIIFKFLKKVPKKIKVIIVENSKNKLLKIKIQKRFKNVKVF